jgi:hypothetical protein
MSYDISAQYIHTNNEDKVHGNLQCMCSFATKRMNSTLVRCENPNYFRFAVVITAVLSCHGVFLAGSV